MRANQEVTEQPLRRGGTARAAGADTEPVAADPVVLPPAAICPRRHETRVSCPVGPASEDGDDLSQAAQFPSRRRRPPPPWRVLGGDRCLHSRSPAAPAHVRQGK